MAAATVYSPEDLEILFEEQEFPWEYSLDVDKDEEFIYMEINANSDSVLDEIDEFGREVEAVSVTEVNRGESYRIAVRK